MDIITIENILTDNLYNDLGVLVDGSKFLLLLEAQATWTMNILIRILLYLAQTYQDFFNTTKQSLYSTKKVQMPKPELYVIFTGDGDDKPDIISLSEEFFHGEDIDIEVKAKVICESDTDDIINQYIIFCKVFDDQRKLYGLTEKAITETIRICKDRNILKEYLKSKEKEVITIMMSLFDQEQVMDIYIQDLTRQLTEEVTQQVTQEVTQQVTKNKALLMLKSKKITIDEVAKFFPELQEDDIKELKDEMVNFV